MGLWVFLSELSGIDLYCCFDKHPIKDETLLMLPFKCYWIEIPDWLLMFCYCCLINIQHVVLIFLRFILFQKDMGL